MTRVASFNRLAEAELREAANYYESEAAGLGKRFIGAVEIALKAIIELPDASAPIRGGIRRKAVGKFPYQILYRQHDENAIHILAVAHKRRRPFYWIECS